MLRISIAAILLLVALAGCSSATPIPNPTALPTQTPSAATPIPRVLPTPTPSAATPIPTAPAVSAQKPITVESWDDYFRPENITVTLGTQVTWVNKGAKKHTVTAGTLFDADILEGQSFSYTFDKPGAYQYYCVIHSLSETDGMVGTVTVVAP